MCDEESEGGTVVRFVTEDDGVEEVCGFELELEGCVDGLHGHTRDVDCGKVMCVVCSIVVVRMLVITEDAGL